MIEQRPEKKSEKLEVRLTYSEKRALQIEAKSEGKTVSELVRGVLKDHIQNQPYIDAALAPVRRHPRSILAGLLAVMSSLGIALAVVPSAQTETLKVEMLGKIESPDAGAKMISRFSSRVELDENGEGGYFLLNGGRSFFVPGTDAEPHKIELSVENIESSERNAGSHQMLLTVRIIEKVDDVVQTASQPSATLVEGQMVNMDVSGDSGIRYTISAQVVSE